MEVLMDDQTPVVDPAADDAATPVVPADDAVDGEEEAADDAAAPAPVDGEVKPEEVA